jgi:hypothetical protein
MTTTEFKRKLKQINKCFNKIDKILDSLPEGLNNEIIEYHYSETTLQHCTRWGLQGSEELIKDSKKIYNKAKKNYRI